MHIIFKGLSYNSGISAYLKGQPNIFSPAVPEVKKVCVLTSNIASSISQSGCLFSFLTGFFTILLRRICIYLHIYSPNKFVHCLSNLRSGRIIFNVF